MIAKRFEPIETRTTDGWFVRIQPQAWSDTVELWIGHSTPTKNTVCYFNEKGQLSEKTFEEYKGLVKKYMEKYTTPSPSQDIPEEKPEVQDSVSIQLSKILLDLDKIKRRLLILG